MRVLLVYPDVRTFGGSYYTGVASLAAVLRRAGHECRLLHVTWTPRRRAVQAAARAFRPGLVAVSATSPQFPYAATLAGWIREVVAAPIVCGGVHPTLRPEEVAARPEFDLVNVGEGEGSIVDLADALEAGRDHAAIPNLWVKTAAGLVRNPPRPPVAVLDALPWPDRSIFDHQKFLDRWGGVARTMASRGCPYRCAFCSNHALRAACGQAEVRPRLRSPASVVAEVERLARDYRVRAVHFDDDLFTLDVDWVRELGRAWRGRVGLPFAVNARVETVDAGMAAALREAGCAQVNMGVETGSEWLRREVLRKPTTNARIQEAFRVAREAGLETCSLNMVGLPRETPAMAEETVALNEGLDPDHLQAAVFYPFPGTDLHALCEREGWLTGATKPSFFEHGSTLRLPTITPRQIRHYHARLRTMSFRRVVARRHRWFLPVLRVLDAALAPFALSGADPVIALRHRVLLPLGDR